MLQRAAELVQRVARRRPSRRRRFERLVTSVIESSRGVCDATFWATTWAMFESRSALVLLAALTGAGCLGSAPVEPLAPGGHHVLFIGNSLTYVNDLPATVAAIAQSAGDTIRVATEAKPNLALIDHLQGGSQAVAQIALGGWELVVLQQDTTTAGICRDSLILWTKMFDPYIRAGGARPALMMTWPIVGVGPPF